MTAQDGNPLKRDTVIAQLELETRQRGFVEYPKMLHRTDGTNITVNNKAEEEAALRSADVHPTPDLALREKAKRDEAERSKAAVKLGEEAQRAADLEAREAALAEREKALEAGGKKAAGGDGKKAAGKGSTDQE